MAEIVVTATGREMNSQDQWDQRHRAAAEQAGAEQRKRSRPFASTGRPSRVSTIATPWRSLFTRELFRMKDGPARNVRRRGGPLRHARKAPSSLAALIGDDLMMTTVYNALGMRLRRRPRPRTLPHRAGAPVGAEWR